MQQQYTQEQMVWLQANNPAELQRHVNEYYAEQEAARVQQLQAQAQAQQPMPQMQQVAQAVTQAMQPVQTVQPASNSALLMSIANEAAEIENHAEIRTGSIARAGLAWLRLLSYVEIGVHPKKNPAHAPSMVAIIEFELHHPDHIDDYQGVRKPRKLQVRVPKTHGANSGFPKFFKALRRAMGDKHDHISQMLGEACLGTIYHNKDTAGNTWENLDVDGAWSFSPLNFVNPADGLTYAVNVPPLHGVPCMFIMDNEKTLANPAHMKAMWDSIYVDGKRTVKGKDGAGDREISNNYYQEQLMKSINWEQSRAKAVLDSVGCTTMTAEIKAALNVKAQVPQQQLTGAMNGMPSLPLQSAGLPPLQQMPAQLQPMQQVQQLAQPQQQLPDTMHVQPLQMLTPASLPQQAQPLQTMPQVQPMQQAAPQGLPVNMPAAMPQAMPQVQGLPQMQMPTGMPLTPQVAQQVQQPVAQAMVLPATATATDFMAQFRQA